MWAGMWPTNKYNIRYVEQPQPARPRHMRYHPSAIGFRTRWYKLNSTTRWERTNDASPCPHFIKAIMESAARQNPATNSTAPDISHTTGTGRDGTPTIASKRPMLGQKSPHTI